jgi:hypothetical protein
MTTRRRKRHFGGVVEHATGFELPDALAADQWATLLRAVARDHASCRWKIGDLARHGEVRYGHMYDRVTAETGLSYSSIATAKSLAGKFEICRRRQSVSWGHHAEVAGLPVAEQDRLLDLAEQNGWSRDTLREAASRIRPAARQPIIRLEITRTESPLVGRPVQTTSTVITVPSRVPASEPEVTPLAMLPQRYRDEVHSPTVSLTAIGSDSEASALRDAIRRLEGLVSDCGWALNASNGETARRLREGIERQLFGVEEGNPKPRRRGLH